MLATSYDSLSKAADVFDEFASDGSICVIGPEDKIKEFKGFDVFET